MKRSRFSEEQIIGILKEHQAGLGAKELCRKHGIEWRKCLMIRFRPDPDQTPGSITNGQERTKP